VGARRVLRRALGLWEDSRVERWWGGDHRSGRRRVGLRQLRQRPHLARGDRWQPGSVARRTHSLHGDAHRWRHDSGCAPRVEPDGVVWRASMEVTLRKTA
jgi:hypothetical protein